MTPKELFKWILIIVFGISAMIAFFLLIVWLAIGELPPILNKYL